MGGTCLGNIICLKSFYTGLSNFSLLEGKFLILYCIIGGFIGFCLRSVVMLLLSLHGHRMASFKVSLPICGVSQGALKGTGSSCSSFKTPFCLLVGVIATLCSTSMGPYEGLYASFMVSDDWRLGGSSVRPAHAVKCRVQREVVSNQSATREPA